MRNSDSYSYFKTTAIGKSLDELIKGSPLTLLGVSRDAATALTHININTIFDLALSGIFQTAVYISALESEDPEILRTRIVPDDLLDNSVDKTNIESLSTLGIKSIRGIGDVTGNELRSALSVNTIRDLALWRLISQLKLL